MGLGLSLVNVDIVIPAGQCEKALNKLNDSWEAWAKPAKGSATLAEALAVLRFATEPSPEGDLAVVGFTGEKSSTERFVLEALARFVRPGSSISFAMEGEGANDDVLVEYRFTMGRLFTEFHSIEPADRNEAHESDHPFDNRSAAHPRARELMDEEVLWSEREAFAPFGSVNDDVYDTWRRWRRRNPRAAVAVLIGKICREEKQPQYTAALLSPQQLADCFSFMDRNPDELDRRIIATALCQLIDEGEIDPSVRETFSIALRRQRTDPALETLRNYRDQRLALLDKIEAIVEQALASP